MIPSLTHSHAWDNIKGIMVVIDEGQNFMNREMKSFFAVALLTVFAFLMVNNLALATPVAEWGLAGVFFVLGAFFAVWSSLPEGEESASELAVAHEETHKAQEWVVSKGTDGKVKISESEALPFDALAEAEANA